MGQFIGVGLVATIKTNFKPQKETLKLTDFCEALQKELDIDLTLYDRIEDKESCTIFNLKSSCLGEPFVTFLKEQCKLSPIFEIPEDVLEELKQAYTLEALTNYLETDTSTDLQMLSFGGYRFKFGNDQEVRINLEAILLARAGKILLEAGEKIFSYFEKNIHFQKYPLAKCVKVGII